MLNWAPDSCRGTLAATLGLLALATGCARPEPAEKPSIVMITIDTIRADHLGSYGYFRDTSPNLDRFASEGLVFERAMTPMATTLPAHISLMTSTLPRTHGIRANWEDFRRSQHHQKKIRTLAQILGDLGYQTAAFVSASPLKTHSGIQMGFQFFDQTQGKQRNARRTTDRVIRWLANRDERPFFLWVHYFDPHWPYSPPPRFKKRFRPDQDLSDFLDNRGFPDSSDPIVRTSNNRYDGEILYLDRQVGRLFEELENRTDWNRLCVVVLGDHGEGLGQHSWMQHGRIYNEQLHVPLILKLPLEAETSRGRLSDLASLIDVVPTLVTALNLPVGDADRDQFEGHDLLSSSDERTYVFSERVEREHDWEPGPKYSLTTDEWKYFHLPQGQDSLFSMTTDWHELEDVLQANPEVGERMKSVILEILSENTPSQAEGDIQELPSELVEELKALGYLD